MEATLRAILLDPEARDPVLERDPSWGQLREPVLKVVHFLRSMEYTDNNNHEVHVRFLERFIAQAPHKAPSVFGFYLPEFQPPGPVGAADLMSPEAQITIPPYVLAFLNGLHSLINYGLTNCHEGFGDKYGHTCSLAASTSDGNLQYVPPTATSGADVVNGIALLLTAGRIDASNRDTIAAAYDATLTDTGDAGQALNTALKLVLALPAFQTTARTVETAPARPAPALRVPTGQPYKAVVVIFLSGGVDSFNLLVPRTCSPKDLFAEYDQERGNIALANASLLPIQDNGQSQPCSTFGMHPDLTTVQSLYNDGDAAWIANIGALVEPVTKAEYDAGTKQLPPSLFAHNVMRRSTQNLHAQASNADGVLGRIVSALGKQASPYVAETYSVAGSVKMVDGEKAATHLDPRKGFVPLLDAEVATPMGDISKREAESMFSETWSMVLETALKQSQYYNTVFNNVPPLDTTFSSDDEFPQSLEQIAAMIKARAETGTERAAFVSWMGGFDTHGDGANSILSEKMQLLDASLASFVTEMKAQGIWDDVAIVTVSDFARTLTSNGKGTDHAWGGHHLVLGGKVRGGQVFGEYPSDLGPEAPLNVGRGRFIPTRSWEAVWKGLAQWMGVEDGRLPEVLPNIGNFADNQLFSKDDLFEP